MAVPKIGAASLAGCSSLVTYRTVLPVAGAVFATKQLLVFYSAMVTKPGLAKCMINRLFLLKPPSIPMKSFTNDMDVKEWLQQFL